MHLSEASVLLVYKNFAANKNVSHIGLGVSAMNTQKVLRKLGLEVDVQPITSVEQLVHSLHQKHRTHVVISAPWIPTAELFRLAVTHTNTRFFVTCHSNVGFLQADRNGIKLFREEIELECGTHNFHVAGNTQRFVHWLHACFDVPCNYLPNLYYLDGFTPDFPTSGGEHCGLRIGAFGATRPLKNFLSAAAAALEIARDLRRPLEFWLSAGRTEGGGNIVIDAVQQLLGGIPGVEVKFNGWQTWPSFRQLVRHMHLLVQPSYTESFNMVTADGIAVGVPSVVSPAIDWAPEYWQADCDNVSSIANAGKRILTHRHAIHDGLAALIKHNTQGVRAWGKALEIHGLGEYQAQTAEGRHSLAA
jgi:hypothetical protein